MNFREGSTKMIRHCPTQNGVPEMLLLVFLKMRSLLQHDDFNDLCY